MLTTQILNAQVLVYSDKHLLDPKIAEIVSKVIAKTSVVVFDEAHNIGNFCNNINSMMNFDFFFFSNLDKVCINSMSIKIDRPLLNKCANSIRDLENRTQL